VDQLPAAQTPPPMAFIQPGLVIPRLRRQQNDDSTGTWLLIALLALVVWYYSYQIVSVLFSIPLFGLDSFGSGSMPDFLQPLGTVTAVLLALGFSLLGPAVIVYVGWNSYQRQLRLVTSDLIHTDIALALVDESYGKMIETWRREKHRPTFNEVPPGTNFVTRLNHFALYYQQYYRLSRGHREFDVQPATQLNCWIDGIVLGCAGGCIVVLILELIRILFVYPRVLATKRAVLDYLEGRWDGALEQKYQERLAAAPPPHSVDWS
jgi:vacuolar-type H+-ATPase subunit F/Vma7